MRLNSVFSLLSGSQSMSEKQLHTPCVPEGLAWEVGMRSRSCTRLQQNLNISYESCHYTDWHIQKIDVAWTLNYLKTQTNKKKNFLWTQLLANWELWVTLAFFFKHFISPDCAFVFMSFGERVTPRKKEKNSKGNSFCYENSNENTMSANREWQISFHPHKSYCICRCCPFETLNVQICSFSGWKNTVVFKWSHTVLSNLASTF